MSRSADRKLLLGVALLLLGTGPLSCGHEESAAQPASTPAPPSATAPMAPAPAVDESETPDTERVAATDTGESQPPALLPEDLPLYAQAIVISSMASQRGGTIVNLRSTDGPDRVFGWYRDELPKRGWIVEKQSGAGGQHLVTARKAGRKATVVITTGAGVAAPGGTRILLTIVDES